ncbi:hypothetical protein BS17DRAFT_769870 [Gyrodon lividus]|nr:hypothetical protein BS17DRAFT_769870 [Gyrodon lividus]
MSHPASKPAVVALSKEEIATWKAYLQERLAALKRQQAGLEGDANEEMQEETRHQGMAQLTKEQQAGQKSKAADSRALACDTCMIASQKCIMSPPGQTAGKGQAQVQHHNNGGALRVRVMGHFAETLGL